MNCTTIEQNYNIQEDDAAYETVMEIVDLQDQQRYNNASLLNAGSAQNYINLVTDHKINEIHIGIKLKHFKNFEERGFKFEELKEQYNQWQHNTAKTAMEIE
ncbi:MAG: hypothetical protein FWE45_01275 [Firmicutes bacterium]|nr:hypothetical protein [Bacillota bacterium]